jgi:hypothetical protein
MLIGAQPTGLDRRTGPPHLWPTQVRQSWVPSGLMSHFPNRRRFFGIPALNAGLGMEQARCSALEPIS